MSGVNFPPGCEQLEKSYILKPINVISSSSIKSKVDQLLAVLTGHPFESAKSPIVVLTAKPKVAGKLISIVEIAKRQLAENNRTYFQYTGLKSQMVEISTPVVQVRQQQGTEQRAANVAANDVEDDELDDSFEVIEEPKAKPDSAVLSARDAKAQASAGVSVGGHKTRAVPLLFICMSTKHIQEFNDIYGEQTNVKT
ncbi:MAG: hypothetical protein M1812_007284 [Candelaria pacifica]|nr:MAG: hypothetical protein M1812_007284 [Candelaria pacifica]